MGCDIHLIVEIKNEKMGKWEYIPEVLRSLNDRNYSTFALLSNVRDNFCDNHFPVRGLPPDISGLRFRFEPESEKRRRIYEENEEEEHYKLPDGTYIRWLPWDLNRTVTPLEFAAWEGEKGIKYSYLKDVKWKEQVKIPNWYIRDPADIGAVKVVLRPKDIYPTFEEYWEKHKDKDDWDEHAQDYGRYKVDFSENGEYHGHNWITLREMLDFDYSDYIMEKCYARGAIWDAFKRLGGVLPEGMTVNDNPEPGTIVQCIRVAGLREVLFQWEPENKVRAWSETPIFEAIEELKKIQQRYKVQSENVRMVFAFDN